MSRSAGRGFTLLEVLVALAIFAVAAVALLRVGESQLSTSGHLEEKTFAHWVALNQITEMQVRQAWPDIGEDRSRTTMAGREWSLVVKTSSTPVTSMKRVEVAVTPVSTDKNDSAEKTPVTVLTGFLDQPRAPAKDARP